MVLISAFGTMSWISVHSSLGTLSIRSNPLNLYVLNLFNFYAQYIMQNARLEEAQTGIKIADRNMNNLRYPDDNTLTAESEELKSLLMKVKEESEKACLKLNIQKMKIMASGPMISWQIDGETMETVIVYFLGFQNHYRWWL